MTASAIFTAAHATARNFRNKAIAYRARFAAGLKMAYAAAKQAAARPAAARFEVSTYKADSPAYASQYKHLERLIAQVGGFLNVTISQFVKCCEYDEAVGMIAAAQTGQPVEVA